ncbi:MAG: hypothetical protein ACYDBP_04645 [Leptospirales bacterium]
MDEQKAQSLFEKAIDYLQINHPDEYQWALKTGPQTFDEITSTAFLGEYCHVVYASGFKVKTIHALFPALEKAFCHFDIDALSTMNSIDHVLKIFGNKRKATNFLSGAKMIHQEGFLNFKERLRKDGLKVLEELPGLGKITKDHLAKNIGFMDVPKSDIWLERAARSCGTTVSELVEYLSIRNQKSKHLVDLAIWRFGADEKLKGY